MKDFKLPWIYPRNLVFSLALLAIAIAGFPGASSAASFKIDGLFDTYAAGLAAPGNVLNTGDASQTVLAHLALDNTATNIYDSASGDFQITLNILDASSSIIGQAMGVSSSLLESAFTGNYGKGTANSFYAGEIVSSISWVIQVTDAGSSLYNHLDTAFGGPGSGGWTWTSQFIDYIYQYDANSYSGNRIETDASGGFMNLTGADGTQQLHAGWPLPYARTGFFDNSNLGLNLALTLTPDVPAPVPEPTTFILLGTGLLGLVGYSRRNRCRV
jgi:hypothetical protein